MSPSIANQVDSSKLSLGAEAKTVPTGQVVSCLSSSFGQLLSRDSPPFLFSKCGYGCSILGMTYRVFTPSFALKLLLKNQQEQQRVAESYSVVQSS